MSNKLLHVYCKYNSSSFSSNEGRVFVVYNNGFVKVLFSVVECQMITHKCIIQDMQYTF